MSSLTHPVTEVPWSVGLFDCFSDVRTCCLACWCPCIPFGKITGIVDKGSTAPIAGGGWYTLLACLGFQCCYSYLYRSKMRKEYNLKGSVSGDCLIHCCCEQCALTQEYNELKNRGFDMNLGWQENVEKQNNKVATAPVAESGMQR